MKQTVNFQILVFILICQASNFTQAQNISGFWQGVLLQPGGPYQAYPYSLDITQATPPPSAVTGFSLIQLPGATQFYGRHSLSGNFANNILTYTTTLVAQNRPGSLFWCDPRPSLTYDPVNESLIGPWAVSGNCAPGTIILYRLTVTSSQTFCENKPVSVTVTGNNIRWYSDSLLTNNVGSGNTFSPAITKTDTFFVTQTNQNIQSPGFPVIITILPTVRTTLTQTTCEGVPVLGYNTTGTYVDTLRTALGCDSIRTLNLTVTPKTRTTISRIICEGQSFEGYTSTGTYTNTFTGSNGCDSIRTLNLTVTPKARTTINRIICEGESFEGYTIAGTYTDTLKNAAANGCDSIRTLILSFKPKVNPLFSFNASLPICAGEIPPSLPTISQNNVPGTWSPSTISNTQPGNYIFTPDPWIKVEDFNSLNNGPLNGQNSWVAGTGSFTPNPPSVGTQPASILVGSDPQNPSNKVAILSGAHAYAYKNIAALNPTDTVTLFMRIQVANIDTIGGNATILQKESAGFFAASDAPNPTEFSTMDMQFGVNPDIGTNNGLSGPWSIRNPTVVYPTITQTTNDSTWYNLWFVIDNNAETFKLYISGGNFANLTQIVSIPGSANSTPSTDAGIFSFRNQATEGPLTALKALIRTGASSYAPIYVDDIFWASKALLSLPGDGSCANPFTLSVSIKPNADPEFPFGNQITLCQNATPPLLPNTSGNSISGIWSPTSISNQNSGSYTFTPAPGTCGNSKTINATILPLPVVAIIKDTTVFDGTSLPQTIINSSVVNSTFTWQNSNPAIGLPGSGTGNIPAFTAVNQTNNPISGTITINPTAANCSGNSISYKITVLPLTKDIYIPNLFSPNGDGKNDMLFVYGNYIEKMEVHIFNQWGEKIITLRDKKQGWDGKHKGKQQPVGVYVYTARIVLRGGQTLNKKGSVTLYR